MVKEGVLLIAGTLGSIVPYYARNTVSLGQFCEIFEIILLEGLLTGSLAVHTAELTKIYRDTLRDKVHIYLLEHLSELSLIVTGSLL